MSHPVLLAFNAVRGMGVREHFFHFMWGYLLPAASAIVDVRSASGSTGGREEFLFTSCGPVMDAKTAEMASLFGVEARIVDERETGGPDVVRVLLPRWDAFLCDHARHARSTWTGGIARAVRQAVQHASVPPVLWSRRRLLDKIRRLRAAVLEKVGVGARPSRGEPDARSYCVLARSVEPAYYAPGGGAMEPTYGTSRRSLGGIERAAAALASGGRRVRVFEPGAHSLTEQIRTFNGCDGIVALRGAELANVVWLEPGSRVISINAGPFLLPAAPAGTLCRLLGIDYVEIDWGEDPFPVFTDELIDRVRTHLGP